MHIRQIDLNLIAVFDAITAEGSLSAAARRLGMSQSAVSHALARLRSITGDELFMRTRHGVTPTKRAIALAGPLRSAVDLVQVAFARRYDPGPGRPRRTFVIDLPVGFDIVLVPPLLSAAAAFGINASLEVHADRAASLVSALRYGDSELALDHAEARARGLVCQPLYKDRFMVCARKGHPRLVEGFGRDDYLRMGHVTLKWDRSSEGSPVDNRIKALGAERTVEVAMPTLAGCASVVAASDLLFTIHQRVASVLGARFDLDVHPMPLPIEPLTIYKIWHERSRDDPGHRWLRNALRQIAKRFLESPR